MRNFGHHHFNLWLPPLAIAASKFFYSNLTLIKIIFIYNKLNLYIKPLLRKSCQVLSFYQNCLNENHFFLKKKMSKSVPNGPLVSKL